MGVFAEFERSMIQDESDLVSNVSGRQVNGGADGRSRKRTRPAVPGCLNSDDKASGWQRSVNESVLVRGLCGGFCGEYKPHHRSHEDSWREI